MNVTERSHAELRDALIVAGREIEKLQFGRRTSPVPEKLRSVLRASRIVVNAERRKVRLKIGG
jgi:hypothetical protein